MNITLSEWMEAADHEVECRRWRDNSRPGKYKFFIKQETIRGYTKEQFHWYFRNLDSETYRLWHPAHKHIMWVDKYGDTPTHIAWERINGKLAAYCVRMGGDMANAPMVPDSMKDKNPRLTEFLDTQGKPYFWTVSTKEETQDGFLLTDCFIFPEGCPDEFVEAHRKHAVEEIPGLAYNAIPALLKKMFGYMPDDETIRKYPSILVSTDLDN